ncbi:WSC domain-containing protein [Apodospora peruviana]|uniref:WSC domain-containing protein n=1 Tax=Apodospora peruviana TaxID=516989 RepID=A0AAE0M7L1_9PEZI|nr:WSC domain-containing protein [Apodospora peruviana]
MASIALAALALAGTVQAWTVELPSCLDPFQPYVYSGCYEDTGKPDALSLRSQLDRNSMTVEKCVSLCKGNGYRYAGLEYYGNCYCGQTVNGAALEEDTCNFPCTGNSSQTCGGSNKISVYQDPTFLPTDEVDVDDYAALGCWTDDSDYGRALAYPQDQLSADTMTSEKCLKACRDGGFPFAGTEYGGECWCGVVIGNDTYSAPSTECNTPCKGDSSETCGGGGHLSLYVAKDLESLEPCGYVPPKPSTSSTSSISSTSSTSTTSTISTTSIRSTTSTSCSTTTTKPPTTSKPPTTTTSTSSTKTSSICLETITIPSTCEYKCGNWCAEPMPDWKDVQGCKNGHSHCKLQVASCFKSAGFPAALDCFDYGSWCSSVSSYCSGGGSKGKCSKSDYWNKYPGKGNKPPTTTVVTTTCKPSTTSTSTTKTTPPTTTTTPTKCPIPTPTNICVQPTNKQYGYGPGNPVGGIELPVVTCNDLGADWPQKPFKLYTDSRSEKCKGYPRNSCTNACADACKEQYDDCNDVYVQGCRQNRRREAEMAAEKSSGISYFDFARALDRRTYGWKDSYGTAQNKCKQQYSDCLYQNRGVTGAGKCPKYGGW